jgi:hypothetical protein
VITPPERARYLAQRDIDRAAGEARLRYITDVPGQQAVYLTKLAEATAYLAAYALDPQSIAPPHIAAEATATESTPLAVAQQVAGLGALWTEGLSPAIEAARLGGKRSVTLATGADDEAIAAAIEAARVAALAALDAI